MNETTTMLNILVEVLDKKKTALSLIKDMTYKQGDMIQSGKSDEPGFNNLIKMKQAKIDQIVQYDDGFAATYDRVKVILNNQPKTYGTYVKQMQTDIMAIGDIAVSIRVQEMRNMRHLQLSNTRSKKTTLQAGAKPTQHVAKQRIDAYTKYEKK